MNRTTTWVILVLLGSLLATSVVASSAFTTVELDRDANINVTADANSLVALTAHEDSEVVTGTDSGALRIDFDPTNTGSGVNVDSTYTVGDSADPTAAYAFTIANNNTAALDLAVAYELDDAISGGEVAFQMYDSDAASLGSVTSGDELTSTLQPGETVYVVIEVSPGADPADDLSGTLTITA